MERNIVDFIEQQSPRLAALEAAANAAYWDFATDGSEANEREMARTRQEYLTGFTDREHYGRLKTYDDECDIKTPELARQVRLLRLEYARHQMPPDVLQRIIEQEAEAERIANTFRARVNGRVMSANDVRQTLVESDDTDERRAVWEASKAVGEKTAPVLLRTVGLRNRAARDLNYRDFYHMSLMLQEIDESRLFALIDDLVERTEKPFRAAKKDLDRELSARFSVPMTRLMPWHYADLFFQEAPPRKTIDPDRFYVDRDPSELTRVFFEGIGLDIEDILTRSDLLPRPGKDQHAFCLHVDRMTDDVRVLSNNSDSEMWMGTMLHEFGHAVYDRYLGSDLPYALREPAHMLVTEAVAMLMGRMSKSPEFLGEVVGANKSLVTRTTNQLREQERLSMLIMARWVPVMVYFERALYENPGRDLNRTWWELVERFQHIRMPEGRDGACDWATKIHLVCAPIYYQNYILGELTASQLRATIREKVASDRFVNEPAVGRFLRERLFSLGARHHWNETLRTVTGEPLSSRHFLAEYVD